jgi:Spy/CpxP family protein refolding chaperone
MTKTAKILAAAAVTLLIPAVLFAGRRTSPPLIPSLPDPAAIAKRIVQELDLTPEQVQEIRDILASHKAELTAELTAVKTAREQQFDAIHVDSYDEAAIRAAGERVGQAETELAVTRGKIVSEVRAVLTPEQQAEAKALLANARARVESFLNRLRQWLQSNPLGGL